MQRNKMTQRDKGFLLRSEPVTTPTRRPAILDRFPWATTISSTRVQVLQLSIMKKYSYTDDNIVI